MNLFIIAARIAATQREDAISFLKAPEYASVKDFVQFLIDDERNVYTAQELRNVSYRTKTSTQKVIVAIEAELYYRLGKLMEEEDAAKAAGADTTKLQSQIDFLSNDLRLEGRTAPEVSAPGTTMFGPKAKPRGWKSNDHDRFYGPGSSAMHGGSGFDMPEPDPGRDTPDKGGWRYKTDFKK
jgi:hypothetical protein